METSWTTGVGDGGVAGDDSRRQNIDVTNNNWDVCNISTHTPANTPYDWSNPARVTEASVVHALLFGVTGNSTFNGAGVESNSVHRRFPDPHMMCLKLGKRHYCEDSSESSTTSKRGKLPYPVSPAPVVVPRCQVEGCHVALGGAKDYYKKHKVCELHSKAPNVVVSGVHQRFCQQCSRFHGVTEFDESKRSCRRRLKGHNQRRRKRTDSIKIGPSKPAGRAYSFLSSPATQPSGDFSSRCSVALYELIAANRATSGNLLNQNANQHQPVSDDSINLKLRRWNLGF